MPILHASFLTHPRSRALFSLAFLVAVGCASDDAPPVTTAPQPSAFADSVMATVGSEGGQLDSASATITIPAGALAAPTTLESRSVNADEEAGLALPPSGWSLVGTPQAFLPHGTTFSSPVDISLRYDEASAPTSVLRLDDEADPTWETVAGVVFENGAAQFQVTSFSIYALAFEGEEPGSGGSGSGGSGSGGASSGGQGNSNTGGALGTGGSPDQGAWDSQFLTIWAENGLAGRADARVQGGATLVQKDANDYNLEPLFDVLHCADFTLPAASAPNGVAQLVVNLDHSEEAPDPNIYFEEGLADMSLQVRTYLDGAAQESNMLLLAADGSTWCRAQTVAEGLTEPSVEMSSFTSDCTPDGTSYDGRALYSVAYEFSASAEDEAFVLCFARAGFTP